MSQRRRLVLSLISLLLLPIAGRVQASPPPCEFDKVDRIVAIGDVHGAFTQFVAILKAAGIIDARQHWAAAKAHLVQVGDVLDRGPDSLQAINLLSNLAKEAESAGGRVHHLLGNHEVMRLLGDFTYTTPGEFKAFETKNSEDLRTRYIKSLPSAERAAAQAKTPLGMVEMMTAFGPSGVYGEYLRGLNAVVRINGTVFVHGGISPVMASWSCKQINEVVQDELTKNIEKTKKTKNASVSTRADGPLWYRGLAEEPDSFGVTVKSILAQQHAQRMVVGHTVLVDGTIKSRFDDTVYLIDTGMQPEYVKTGRPSALEFLGPIVTAIYLDKRDVLHIGRGSLPSGFGPSLP